MQYIFVLTLFFTSQNFFFHWNFLVDTLKIIYSAKYQNLLYQFFFDDSKIWKFNDFWKKHKHTNHEGIYIYVMGTKKQKKSHREDNAHLNSQQEAEHEGFYRRAPQKHQRRVGVSHRRSSLVTPMYLVGKIKGRDEKFWSTQYECIALW